MPTWIRPWLAWALLVAALTAALGLQTVRLSDERADHQTTKADYNKRVADAEKAGRQAAEDARAEEQRRTAAVQGIADDAQKKLDAARTDAVAARDAGERLRARLAQLTAACRATSSNPNAANAGPAAEPTADLLADVQRRLDEATDGIAGFADSAHTSGKACERSYDALTTHPAGGLGLKR